MARFPTSHAPSRPTTHVPSRPTSHVPSLTSLAALLVLTTTASAQTRNCDGFSTPLIVPAGHCVRIYADSVGPVRHMIVHPSGWVVAATNREPGLVRFKDVTGDGHADQVIRFGPGTGGTGVTWHAGWLYFAADNSVIRYRWPANAPAPAERGEVIAANLPAGIPGAAHTMKGIAVGRDGAVYVSIGSESDNCQKEDRPHAPGQWPCPELDRRAGIWRFTPPRAGQTAWAVDRFASGLRNAEAIGIDSITGHIWAATNGRDFLNREWGWSDSASADQPAEMLEQILAGGDYGWPYCQGNYAPNRTSLIKAPEYAGQQAIDCALKIQPVMGFPGHWAPIALAVAAGTSGAEWTRGLFIAFHGSRGRAPLPEAGHQVLFVPFDPNGRPAGEFRPFLRTTEKAGALRPSGVAIGPDGSVYVADDDHGRIYRIEPHPPKAH